MVYNAPWDSAFEDLRQTRDFYVVVCECQYVYPHVHAYTYDYRCVSAAQTDLLITRVARNTTNACLLCRNHVRRLKIPFYDSMRYSIILVSVQEQKKK